MKTFLIYIPYLCLACLPNILKRVIYTKVLGWEIHKTAKIGFSFIHAQKVKMGAGTKIKHFNVIRNLELLDMRDHACIGNSNIMSALPLESTRHFGTEDNRVQALIMGEYSAIIKKHYFDCNNTITIGHHSIIAGFGSAFFTHSINLMDNQQETKEIHISNYCMVGALSVITKGAVLPECCVLTANSTLHKAYDQTHTLYSGVPAVPVKTLDTACKYFYRETGFVD